MKKPACISTIILNWNRAACLKKTVESYLSTINAPYQLIVVDNASTDGSVAYLREIEASGKAHVVYLDENIGGLAYNKVFDLANDQMPGQAQGKLSGKLNGELIHLSENDQLFLPGWSEHARESFELFDDLGQLSLFADVPTDDEAWGAKPSKLRFRKGKILYEAQHSLGTSCIMRAELVFKHGVRITNLACADVKLPADEMISIAVKAAGFWCAWSDRYYVRNLGHEVAEFEANEEYYRANYANKGIGVEGWQARIAAQHAQPKFIRESAMFPDRHAVPEKTEAPVKGKAARLWSMFDTRTPEVETLDFIYALTRLMKPAVALETNTWLGLTTCAVAKAQRANGFGEITTLESDADVQATAIKNIAAYGLAPIVKAILGDDLPAGTRQKFDLAIFNAAPNQQIDRFLKFRDYLANDCIVVFCDAYGSFSTIADENSSLTLRGLINAFPLPTPRSLLIGRVIRNNL